MLILLSLSFGSLILGTGAVYRAAFRMQSQQEAEKNWNIDQSGRSEYQRQNSTSNK